MASFRAFDRALCVSAGVLGIGCFVAGLATGHTWALIVGVVALLTGLTTASFATWRPRGK